MDRSQSILKSLVAATLFTAGLLSAEFAMAQRAISASRNGGLGGLATVQSVPGLVGCNRFNTFSLAGPSSPGLGGIADDCAVEASGETIEAASRLVAGYVGKPNSAYTLSLAIGATPERAIADGVNSSGTLTPGLFQLSGVGTDAVTLEFQRAQVDDFLFAFSGYYPVIDGLNSTRRAWSAYYLFDDVFVEPYSNTSGVIRGQMNFELFEDVRVANSSDLTRNYTTGLVVNQVSIYTLDRQAVPVPEPGSIALAGLGLALLAGARRLRRSTRA